MEHDRANRPKSADAEPGTQGPAVGKQTRSEDNLEGGEGSQGPSTAGKGGGGSAGKITAQGALGPIAGPIANIGIGSKVTFSAQEEGTWRLDQQELGRGQSIPYEAPDKATMGNLVFEPYLTSPNKNKQASMPVMVAAPTSIEFKKIGDRPAAGPGFAGVGMTTELKFAPTNVTFDALKWLEKPSGVEGPQGYFEQYLKQTGKSLDHKPNTEWMKATELRDSAFSADKPKLTHPTDKTKRWWAGQYHWTIPNYYKIGDSGKEQLFTTVTQTFTMADDGTMTVTKGAATATAKPGGDTGGDLQVFKDVGEARAYIQVHKNRAEWIPAVMNYKRNPKADPASVRFLVAALREAGLCLKVTVHANKTYSWTDADTVTIKSGKAAARSGPRKVNNDGHDVTFDLNASELFDFDTMTGTENIPIEASFEDHTSTHQASTTISYPYDAQGQALGERHTISTTIGYAG